MKKLFLFLPLIYLPSLFTFFSADDWYHLRIAQINSLWQFLNFFSFEHTAQSISFYRPLSTQVFFFIFQKIFGLNPYPYHIFVLVCFFLSLFLVYRLAAHLLNSKSKAVLSVVIYGFSVSNFTRIYFISAFQEIVLVMFSLLCILHYLKSGMRNRLLSLGFFFLALLSKETAVILPVVFILLDWSKKQINFRKIIPFVLILLPYLYLRLFRFGLVAGDSYTWDFSPIKAANTLVWYVLWAVGSPELLIDYIGSGFRPINKFFVDFPYWWPAILGLTVSTTSLLGFLFLKSVNKLGRTILTFVVLFVLSLSPVIFLPSHKFTLELGLPLVWFSFAVAILVPVKGKLLQLFLTLFLLLNLSMNYLTYSHHYSVNRGVISKKVYDHFSTQYSKAPENSYFEFVNDTPLKSKEWGSSKQIANSIGGSELFRVIYRDEQYNVYFEDLSGVRPSAKQIPISTKMFLE